MGKGKEVSSEEETGMRIDSVVFNNCHTKLKKLQVRNDSLSSSHEFDSSGNSTPTISSSDSSDVDVSSFFFLLSPQLFFNLS